MTVTAYNPQVLFTGEIVRASVRGSVITFRAVPGGTLFDRRVPRMRIQAGCNHALFSVGCGLDAAAWRLQAVVVEVEDAWPWKVTLGDFTRPAGGGVPSLVDGWFAGGHMVDPAGVRHRLVGSGPESGGNVVVTPRKRTGLVDDDVVDIWPGCDGRKETCKVKFGNWANFGGHPFVPIGNPSLLKVSSRVGGGKK